MLTGQLRFPKLLYTCWFALVAEGMILPTKIKIYFAAKIVICFFNSCEKISNEHFLNYFGKKQAINER
jgi:hypothetical protein